MAAVGGQGVRTQQSPLPSSTPCRHHAYPQVICDPLKLLTTPQRVMTHSLRTPALYLYYFSSLPPYSLLPENSNIPHPKQAGTAIISCLSASHLPIVTGNLAEENSQGTRNQTLWNFAG